MVRVKTFLGCIQMETGGTCVGWFFFTTFLTATAVLFGFGGLSIILNPHPLYTLIWLDIIIFWIIVIYASWLMIQGIKTKNHPKIQPFRIFSLASIVLVLLELFYYVYRIYNQPNTSEAKVIYPIYSVNLEWDFFEVLERDYKAVRISASLLLLAWTIYLFIFIDSLHKTVKESRNRLYAVAKL